MKESDIKGRHAAIVFIDMIQHAKVLSNLRDPHKVQDMLIKSMKAIVKSILDGDTRSSAGMVKAQYQVYSCFHKNFTGDGYLLLFDEADDAALFCLTFSERWDGELEEMKARQTFPQGLNIGFRAALHFGKVYPLAPEYEERRDYTSPSINLASRLLSVQVQPGAVATEGFRDLTNQGYFSWRAGPQVNLVGDRYERQLWVLEEKEDRDFDLGKLDSETKPKGDPDLALRLFLDAQLLIGTDSQSSDEQIKKYKLAIKYGFKSAVAHSNLGNALGDKGDLDGAIRECREAVRIDPDYAGAHNNLGVAFEVKGDLDGAIREYREALRLDPDLAFAHKNLGNALYSKGDLEGAIAEYREALQLDPDYAAAYHQLGVVLLKNGDFEGAMKEFREAIGRDPDDVGAHNSLGVALYHKGDLEGAISEIREALRLDPDDANAHNNLGFALYYKGDLDGAIGEYREALRLDPDHDFAPKNLDVALQANDDLEGAIREYREALRLDPDDANMWTGLGLLYLLCDKEEARKGFLKGREFSKPGEWAYDIMPAFL